MSAAYRRLEGSGIESLAEILEPCAPGEFLDSSWGANSLHVRGRAGRFARMMPWARLSEILRRHRLDFPRLRRAPEEHHPEAQSGRANAPTARGGDARPRRR